MSFFWKLQFLSKSELLLTYLFFVVWALHFLQVLVPETGFDALWYHLPIVSKMAQVQGLVYLPKLYQSVNPLFSDLYFLTGFSVFGIFGAKTIAYIFASFLSLASYSLARFFVSRKFAILIALTVSTFQVVSWQSASFYIDVAKAFFEIAGLLLLFCSATTDISFSDKNFYSKTGLLFLSASLATKLFSLLLAPIFIVLFGLKDFFNKKIILHIFLLFCLPFFYYWFAYIYTGNPFYSLVIHTEKLQEIGGQESPILYIVQKIITLPLSVISFATARDYVNPILVLFFIPITIRIKKIWKDEKLRMLFLFSVAQWVIWWFVPPLSTRYALSGFITVLILGTSVVIREYATNLKFQKLFLLILLFLVIVATIPRIIVAKRSLHYLLTNQTRQNYLQQFYDGSIDEKINNWYGL